MMSVFSKLLGFFLAILSVFFPMENRALAQVVEKYPLGSTVFDLNTEDPDDVEDYLRQRFNIPADIEISVYEGILYKLEDGKMIVLQPDDESIIMSVVPTTS